MVSDAFFIGRLTRDAEVQFMKSGFQIAKLSIAVNKRVKSGDKYEDHADFFDIKLLGKRAESLAPHCTKGKLVYIRAEIKQNIWTTSEGKKRYDIEFIEREFSFLASPDGGGGANRSDGKDQKSEPPPADDFEDDLPF